MKSGNRNFLEPFGPLQACNGNALTKSSVRLHVRPIASCPCLRENGFLTTKLFLILHVRLFWSVAQLHITRLTVTDSDPPVSGDEACITPGN